MLLALLKQLIGSQLDAALSTMNACVRQCPPGVWNARVGNLTFDQVAFHALFYADYYLGPDEASFRGQPFHHEHAATFRDYEEFEDRVQVAHYEAPFLVAYVHHCRAKADEAIAAETEQTLAGRCGFSRRPMSRAELYVYNTRHLQHHAASACASASTPTSTPPGRRRLAGGVTSSMRRALRRIKSSGGGWTPRRQGRQGTAPRKTGKKF